MTKAKTSEFDEVISEYIEIFNEKPPIYEHVCDCALAPKRNLLSLLKKAIVAKTPLHCSQVYVNAWHLPEQHFPGAVLKTFKMTFSAYDVPNATAHLKTYEIDADGFVKIEESVKAFNRPKVVIQTYWKNIVSVDCVYDCLAKIATIISAPNEVVDFVSDRGGSVNYIKTTAYNLFNIDGRLRSLNDDTTVYSAIDELREQIDEFKQSDY